MPSSSSLSSSSSSTPVTQPTSSTSPITAAALLAQHASASNPHAAALEQAVTDRNALAAQNAQLWKLVEKQRAGYSQIMRELERVRGEREYWRSRGGGKKDEYQQNSGHSSGTGNDPVSTTSKQARPRKSSDDQAPRSSSSASSHSQSQSLVSHTERQRAGSASSLHSLPYISSSNSQPASSTATDSVITPPNATNTSSTPNSVPTSVNVSFPSLGSSPVHARTAPTHPSPHHSGHTSNSHHHHVHSSHSSQRSQSPIHHHPQSQRSAASPSPLGILQPTRSESLPSPLQQQSQQPRPLNSVPPPRKMSLDGHPSTNHSSAGSGVIGPSPLSQSQPISQPYSPQAGAQPHMLSPDLGLGSPNPPFMHSRGSRDSQGSHDSRITLPEEARAYIVNMADSPIPSPRVGQSVPQPSNLSGNQATGSNDTSGEKKHTGNVLDDEAPPISAARGVMKVANPDPEGEDPKDDGHYTNGYDRSNEYDTNGPIKGPHGPPPPIVTIVPASAPSSALSKTLSPVERGKKSANETHITTHNQGPSTDVARDELGSMFLDMGDESGLDEGSGVEDEYGDRVSVVGGSTNTGLDGTSQGPESSVGSDDGGSTVKAFDSSFERSHSKDKGKRAKPRAAVDDFPLPPSSHGAPSSHLPTSHPSSSSSPPDTLHSADSTSFSLTTSSTNLLSASTSTSTLASASSSNIPSNLASTSNLSSSTANPFLIPNGSTTLIVSSLDKDNKFRALPLLPSDLPYTTVTVSSSFVRPNEKGKEVLSFTVHISIDREGGRSRPSGEHDGEKARAKESWTVEKMYSDVLALDQRVRASVGKGVGKKIASLPEGRLWKDHAPAKVDQRKAVLENYLQTLVNLPVKSNDEVIAFLTSDIVRDAKKPVLQVGHKEGYLTKRGKNFGGWKTRYFVLQGPVLEYYDCRGGTHLGSIQITGAQIGRQQRMENRGPSVDDEKEYRHAFLIVEARKNAAGNHPRHVLCAESDEDRDSWVEMLVRYFTGVYTEEPVTYGARGVSPISTNTGLEQTKAVSNGYGQPPPRSSSSIDIPPPYTPRESAQRRAMSKDDIMISKGTAVPISQLAPDASNAKLFQSAPIPIESTTSPVKTHPSPVEREKLGGQPSSIPDSGPLSASVATQNNIASSSSPLRSNSEMGHYSDLQEAGKHRQASPEKHRERMDSRKSLNPSLASNTTLVPPNGDRVPSPDKMDKVKISGPLNGAPIPAGYKFGGKDTAEAGSTTPNDRREKAKSRSFWGFGRPNDKLQPMPTFIPRAVFGVPLEESLDVAQIANLPAIVFRAIQYLEAKRADQEEGIYRLSGSSAVIKSLKDRFNAEGDVDLLASDEYWDPHAIAGLLKSFLRELPASILTRDLHMKFLAVIDFVDAQDRIKELSQLIAALPLANYSLLRALTAHLILIVQNSSVNKMTMRNVGIVFSPTLGIPAGVFSLMLGEFNRVFNVDVDNDSEQAGDKATASGSDGEKSTAGEGLTDRVEMDRRNSQRYSDAAADQLLGLAGRKLTVPTEEGQSDGDDFSLQDESGTEITEGEVTVESSTPDPGPGSSSQHHSDSPETPTVSKISKASHVAATRGLNVAITPSERGHRYSRMMGLPSSPRPPISPRREATSPEKTSP